MKAHRATPRFVSALLLLLLIGPALQSHAQSAVSQKITVHLDPAGTQIHWTLADPLHTVHGTFALKGGLITIDPQTGMAQGEVIIDVTSGQSGSPSRDRRMHRDVLESTKFPQAIFHPETVTGAIHPGTSQNVTVKGTFTMHGSDHPLELPMAIQVTGKDAVATTHFAVPYVAWGMKDPSSALIHVAKQVDVEVVAKGSVDGLPQP